MVQFEKEILEHFNLPQIPAEKHIWDGQSSFKDGIAVTELKFGGNAYAACTFDADVDKEPRIIKAFAQEVFVGIKQIVVVPSFMDTDVENMDLDEESKKAAERLIEEANELTETQEDGVEMPKNEYSFDHIHNDDEAIAFISSYNKENGIRGSVPTKHDTIVMRLAVIYADLQKKSGNVKK